MLGQLFQSLYLKRIAGFAELSPYGERGLIAAEFSFQESHVPESFEQQGVGQTGVHGAPQQGAGLFRLSAIPQPSSDSRQLRAVFERRIDGVAEGKRHDSGEAG